MQAHHLPALLALVSLACVAQVRDGGEAQPKPNAGEVEPAEDAAEGAAPPRAEAEAEAELEDCPPEPGPDAYCDTDNKLVGQWMPVDRVDIPEGANMVFDADHAEVEGRPGLTLAVVGDALFIRQVTCGSCRRIIGQGFAGWPALMSEAQLRDMQTRLGLGVDAPLLDSTEAAARYAQDPRGRARLDEISLETRADE